MAYIIGISGAPLSALLHVDGTTVFNETIGIGGSEQIDVPMNNLKLVCFMIHLLVATPTCVSHDT